MRPIISIIVPCFNQAQYLEECLQSVLNQVYKNWECIIVNDGSTDHTEEIAFQWIAKDNRYKYIKKENGGLSSARNTGIETSKGTFLQFLDSDDLIHKEKLQSSSVYFNTHDLILSDYKTFNEEGISGKYCEYINRNLTLRDIIFGWDNEFSIPIHAGIFRKTRCKLFLENLKAKEDWIFWINFFHENPKVSIIKHELALYRIHKKSMTRDSKLMFDNEIAAFKIILNLLDSIDKELFFINKLKFKNSEILKYEETLRSVQMSRSYKFLNFLISLIRRNKS